MRSRMQLVVSLMVMVLLVPCMIRAAEEPTVYVIQKGDTLWGLSGKFLNNPRYWPNLWSKNPQVTNPHFIYPGQTVRFVNGKLEVVDAPAEAGAQKAAAQSIAVADAEVAEEKLFTVRGNEGWLVEKELVPTGRIIAGQHGRLVLGEDDTVFTDVGRSHGGADGSKYTILRKSKEVKHPVTGDVVGFRVYPLGMMQLTQVTELNSRGIISSSYKEVEPGDLLVPYQSVRRRTVALKMTTKPLRGAIVESTEANAAIAAGDVVYLDLGTSQGAEPGNLLYVVRKVAIEKMLVDRYVGQLPSEVVGAVVIVEAGNNTSTAIVVKSIDAIFKGNEVVSAPR
ncbi:MAG: LysM peptidoglycan-binding domain-containing protein [Geobacteraceae bacterium]|nr:LysM peptidoglycan-binding domain-containing protein [Geobacteraceae bacterium]